MAGEYDDYKRSEDEIRRDEARKYGFWYRPKIPLWKKILKAAYWLAAPVLMLGAVIGSFIASGVESGLMVLGGLLLVFVVIPLLFWLSSKYSWAYIISLSLFLLLLLFPVLSFIFRIISSLLF